jgi:hypothetical protein
LLASVDDLYRAVVTAPEGWNEQAFADWAGDVLGDVADLPRPAHRELRRCLQAARKLQRFWTAPQAPSRGESDWRSLVDVALGARAWRPTLELARIGLDDAPDPELFDEVKARFRVVHSERWMEGVDFAGWLAERNG